VGARINPLPIDQSIRFRRAFRTIDLATRPFVRYSGFELPPETLDAFRGPCIVAANHRSLFDALAAIRVLGSLGQSARVASAAWLWENRVLGRLLNQIGAIPVHPGSGGLATVEVAVAALERGDTLVMTPEGRVVPRADRPTGVGGGHKILSRIARRADVPVIPAALVGTDEVWPLDRRTPRLRPWRRPLVQYGFGPPVRFDSDAHRRNVDDTLAAIAALTHLLESDRPPARS
jgi:1-acyl-sn-glycerol-3-phosphate acyltransferase